MRDGFPEVVRDERRRQPQHAPPAATELAVTSRVGRATSGVTFAVHLNHEPPRWDREVRDVPPDDVLAADDNAEPPATELTEERLFRRQQRGQFSGSAAKTWASNHALAR
ncbi:MAG: hypothetical protein AMXMBFR56_21980 [Polyangiaceae bacterium]